MALYHLENLSQDEMGSKYELLSEFTTMSVPAMNYQLGKFMLEVRTKSGKEYCLDSLYQLRCGLLRSLREAILQPHIVCMELILMYFLLAHITSFI